MNTIFISGERIQRLCDVYIGGLGDVHWSPHSPKCIHIHSILQKSNISQHYLVPAPKKKWNNPYTIFCCGHRLPEFQQIQHMMQNPYILFTHNSDTNVTNKYIHIANHALLRVWYAQNLLFHHPKVSLIPIGIANSIWKHGDVYALEYICSSAIPVSKNFYFWFSTGTNPAARTPCRQILEKKGLRFGVYSANYTMYLKELAAHKYAICPPGNGVDSHRIWEALYLGVIPILIRSFFTEKIAARFPCILLDTWDDFCANTLLQKYVRPKKADYYPYLDMKNILVRN